MYLNLAWQISFSNLYLRLETSNRWQHTLHKANFSITLKFSKVPKEEKSDRLLARIVLKTDEANGLMSKKEDEIDVLQASIPQVQGHFAIRHLELIFR